MEITKALPDKAHKRKRVCISKSPDIFAPGDGTRLRTMPLYDCRAYADAAVGIFVGIYETPSLDWHIQPSDMNSVGHRCAARTLRGRSFLSTVPRDVCRLRQPMFACG
ncbi:hypothetical protein DO72_2107 [Burkholderia pseudomallei]|nr:hypothetical protein DO72_2107 [Burkholderia pseudomallei]